MKNSTYNQFSTFFIFLLGLGLSFGLTSCDDDEGFTPSAPENPSTVYRLNTANGSSINGYIRFSKNDDNSTEVLVFVEGTEAGNTHPAQIHANTIVEGGDVAISLEPVNGATGRSVTTVTQTGAGTALTYDQLIDYDGYADVYVSSSDPTAVVQADIGGNALTGTAKTYALSEAGNSSNKGSLLLAQRKNGNSLATITLDSAQNLTEGASYPAQLRSNNATETGEVAVQLNSVSGTTGKSATTIRAAADGTPLTYGTIVGNRDDDILGFDGYVEVQQVDNPAALIVQGDIGANELTGESVTYPLAEKAVPGIKGEAIFEERQNGQTRVTLSLEGTPDGGIHPAHIHSNTAVVGGGIVVPFNPVNGTTGMSVTNVSATDDGTPISYDSLLNYDGYINVHLSAADLGTFVAQGDIGQNALTGESETYPLDSIADPDIKGEAVFYQRNNGTTLVEVTLEGTPAGGMHPAAIRANTAAEGGDIVIALNPVDGTTGVSLTQVGAFDDGNDVTYGELLGYDGYVDVRLSEVNPETIVARGDIGKNALTGESAEYTLVAVGSSGVSGTATFAERNDETTLITIVLTGTQAGGNHPAHIHYNSAAVGGAIAIDLTNVDGATGVSKTSVMVTNNNVPIKYEALLAFDGYINVHLSPENLATIVAQGDIGANVVEE